MSKIISIGSGKGGVGKSIITANLAAHLASNGKKVIAIDSDFGGSNLHTYLGINSPDKSISDILVKNLKNIEDVIIDTEIENLKLISADSGFISITNMKFVQKSKILKEILKLDADYILMDLGAGSAINIIDFFLLSSFPIVITVPEITSFENAYTFLKNCTFRHILNGIKKYAFWYKKVINYFVHPYQYNIFSINDLLNKMEKENKEIFDIIVDQIENFQPNLILNRITQLSEINLGERIKQIVKKYLNVDLHFLGYFEEDYSVKTLINQNQLIIKKNPFSKISLRIKDLAETIINQEKYGKQHIIKTN